MNYEERYKQALERAKKVHDGELTISSNEVNDFNVYEYIFPELRESEDEKIRKSILELVKQSSHILNHMNQKSMLAWLEKQKPIKLDKGAEIRFRSILNLIDNGCPIEKSYIDFIKSVYAMLMKLQQKKLGEKDWLEKKSEQKPANSAWNEGDEKMINDVILDLKGLKKKDLGKEGKAAYQREIDWLKSLKPNHWKPSERQLECLEYAITKAEKDLSPLSNNRIYLTLRSLKEQLEKL